MKAWYSTTASMLLLTCLTACGGGGTDSGNEGDIIPPPPSSSSSGGGSSSGGSSGGGGETSLSENFGDDEFVNIDRNDNITLFSPEYKAVEVENGDEWPSFYYPTCCYFDDESAAGDGYIDDLAERLGLVNDNGNPALLIHNARFAVGQTKPDNDASDPKVNSTTSDDITTWGELDLSQDYRISFCVKEADGSGLMQIYVDNNTTGEANSFHGGGAQGSRIFNANASLLVPGERVEVNIPGDTLVAGERVDDRPALVGTTSSFLQIRADSGATVIIDDLLIEPQDEDGQAELPACNVFTPATAPDAPEAPTVTAGDAKATVSWGGVVGAIQYDIAYGTDNNVANADVVPDIDSPHVLDGLTNDTEYFVFLRVKNAVDWSDWSEAGSATPVAPVGGDCVATTQIEGTTLDWGVWDGCKAPHEVGAVMVDGSTPSNFSVPEADQPFFTPDEKGTTKFDSSVGGVTPKADLTGVITDTSGYPRSFTWIGRINTPNDAVRGIEMELSFGEEDKRRVKLLLRPDQGSDGRVQLEKFTDGSETAEGDMAMTGGFHIYHVVYTLNAAADITARVYRNGENVSHLFVVGGTGEETEFSGTGSTSGSSSPRLRIGDGGSSDYVADIDWMIWSDDAGIAAMEPADLVGELPDGIGELGAYGAEDTAVLREDFNGASEDDGNGSSFFTLEYKATSSGSAFYNVTGSGSRINLADGALSFNNARFSIGETNPDINTAPETAPSGDIDLSNPYVISFDVTANENVNDGSGKCQVYVDNNTTSSGSSLHGEDSKILEKEVWALADDDQPTGTVTVTSDPAEHIGTETSFLQLRCDSGVETPITIDNLVIEYQ